MRVFISVCDHSSELYAEFIIKRLLKDLNVEIFLIGGDKLRNLSNFDNRIHFWIDSVKYSSIGFFENLATLPFMYADYLRLKRLLLSTTLDVAILFDAPAVNLKLIKLLKNKGVRVIYIIPPKSWSLVRTKIHHFLESSCDYIIVPFKFNLDVYKGANVLYFGHPISTLIPKLNISRDRSYLDYLAIFPGSRKIEVNFVSQDVFNLINLFLKNFRKVFISSTTVTKDYIKNHLGKLKVFSDNVEVVSSYDEIVSKVGLSLAVSGTITLQNALLTLPTICFYKVFKISEFIFRNVMRMNVDKIALPNILWKYEFKLGDENIILELVQGQLNRDNILYSLNYIMERYEEFLSKLVIFRDTFFEFYGRDSLEKISDFIVDFLRGIK